MFPDYMGIQQNLSDDVGRRVVSHRDRFTRIFFQRYLEMLPSTITYYNGESVAVDWLKVEWALRANFDVVIGQDAVGNIQMLGYATSRMTPSSITTFFGSTSPLRYNDITWTIPNYLKPPRKGFKEITKLDNCQTGNFIVLRNKTLNYVSDHELILHYITELAEIVVSRYSVTIQSKMLTLFLGDVNDETINQAVSDYLNGNPILKMSKAFDPEEQIIQLEPKEVSTLLGTLKNEYQNKISELNSSIGMNSLAVDKQSGVSDTEAKSSRAFTTNVGNIYIDARQNGLDCLNKRFDLSIYAMYNDDAVSKMTVIESLVPETKAPVTADSPEEKEANGSEDNNNS